MSSDSSGSADTQPRTLLNPPSDDNFRNIHPNAIPPTWAVQSIPELGDKAKMMFMAIIATINHRDFIGITPNR
jgi:hypothetical protein